MTLQKNNEAQSVFDSSQTVQIDVHIDPHKAVLHESIVLANQSLKICGFC